MARYVLYRLAGAIPVIVGVVLLTFLMVRLVPGDPVDQMFPFRKPTPEERAAIEHQLGLDRPIYVQLGQYLVDVARGDLGASVRNRRPVTDEIRLRLPNTLKLTLASLVVTTVVGVAVGIVSAVYKGRAVDLLSMITATLFISIPSFWFGLMLILFFALRLGWFPVSGAETWKHLVLPAVALGMPSAAIVARVARASMLEVLGQDHVRTARAKGLRELRVILLHGVRNALTPIVTVLGFQVGGLLTGAFIVETVFGYPGIGLLAVRALLERDFPVLQGVVLFVAVIYVLVNLIVDLLYGVLDPRVREAGRAGRG